MTFVNDHQIILRGSSLASKMALSPVFFRQKARIIFLYRCNIPILLSSRDQNYPFFDSFELLYICLPLEKNFSCLYSSSSISLITWFNLSFGFLGKICRKNGSKINRFYLFYLWQSRFALWILSHHQKIILYPVSK